MKPDISTLAALASVCLIATLAGCDRTQPAESGTESSPTSAERQQRHGGSLPAVSSQDTLIDFRAVSVVGRNLRRNELLAGLIAANGATQTGSVADRRVDINEQQTTTAHLLALLLTDTVYSASFAPDTNGNTRLINLTLGTALHEAAEAREDLLPEPEGERQIAVAETSEERTRELAEIIATGEPEDVTYAIDRIDITPGGVDLLTSLVVSDNPVDVQLAAMKRLDLADEYAAKGAVLEALKSPRTEVVLAAISSIDVWRDPTVLPQISALLNHGNKRVREQAQLLRDDLRSYLATSPPLAPEDTGYSGDAEVITPDVTELEEETARLLPTN